ncbi:signal peptidase I [Phycisphaeraceae bacterium D3-23]
MTQTPDPSTPPDRPEGEDDRVSKLIDAVVGEGDSDSEAGDMGEAPSLAESADDDKVVAKGNDEPADQDAPKLTRKERKEKHKLEQEKERAKYDNYFSYYWHTTVNQLRESIREHGSFRAYFWHKWVKPVGSVILIVVILRSTLLDWNDVPSGSMEPTILVGDRILVNKMAYALQAPMSGPKIGVPFTPLQWDNPLDGIPSWQWGRPSRGEIVTFWNPSTGIRMVKRIVAEPGDTIEIRGGVMTLTPADGSPTTATYVDTSTFPANRTIVGKDQNGVDIERQTEDRAETILGETRSIQHIRRRWIESWGMVRMPGGQEIFAIDGVVNLSIEDNRELGVRRFDEDDGIFYRIQGEGIPIERLRAGIGEGFVHLAIIGGEPFIDGESVSHNEFAEAYLRPIAEKGPFDFNGTSIGVEGHSWLIDGEPANAEQMQVALAEAGFIAGSAQVQTQAQRNLIQRFTILRDLIMSSFGPVTLGENEYYMVGDNRNNSHDSRYFGPVMRSEITGEAIAIPASFHGRIRDLKPNWSRWFHGLD